MPRRGPAADHRRPLPAQLPAGPDESAIAAESNGLRVQFDLASARRANGITIDWVDDIRGKGLAIDNPNAPKPVQEISVRDADDLVRAGNITLVDVRPADEREIAAVGVPFKTFDGNGRAELEALPKDTALAFMCHHGGRSAAPNSSVRWASPRCSTSPAASMHGRKTSTTACRSTDRPQHGVRALAAGSGSDSSTENAGIRRRFLHSRLAWIYPAKPPSAR